MNKDITELVAADLVQLDATCQCAPDQADEGTAAILQAVIEALRNQQGVLVAHNRTLLEQNAELARARDHYRQLFEANPEPLWVMEGERFVEANPAACRVFGHADRAALLDARVDPAIAGPARLAALGEIQRVELEHAVGGALEGLAEVTLAPLPGDGRRLVLGSWRDVSLARSVERQLIASERQAREDNQRLRELMQGTHTGMWEWNLETDRLVVNPRWAEIIGRKDDLPANLTFDTWYERIHPEDRDHALLQIRRCCAGEIEQFRIELRVRHAEGHWLWTVERGRIVNWTAQRRPLRMAGTCQDITRHKQAEEQLKLAASVFTHASEGILITDANVRIVSVNRAFTRITGYAADEVIGCSPAVLRSGLHSPEFYAAIWQALRETGHWSGEIWNRHKDGHLYAELANISTVCNEQGQVENYVALFTDITAAKNHQQQLEYSANYDALTDLPNRLLLADRLHQAMARARRNGGRIAVAYIDLDGFKAVNDQHGHDVGDQLLVALAGRMKGLLRENDTLARLGGDEFVAVIVDMVRLQDCTQAIERLLRALADPVLIGERVLHVSASIGVTLYPADDVDADQLLRHADQAMYIAKQTGKNRYQLFDGQPARIAPEPERELELLRQALERNELRLHYQPRVNMRTGQVVGAEALLRWQHPERGLLLPGEFLGALQHHSLAAAIGHWVIDQVLCQIALWRSQGLQIPVSVNIAPRHLQQRDFIAALKALLRAHPSVEPAMLELELMESHALDDIDYVGEVMEACQQLGMRFALDDFGTGYTSLSYLRRLPADTLKLDHSLVQAMPSERDDLYMVEAVRGMAGAFRRRLVAEGVETEWQGEMLLALGCELAQGFAIARPMPAEALPGWAATWQPPANWQAWASHVLTAQTLPVLLATVEHSAWRDQLIAHLEGRDEHLPPIHYDDCRFAAWYRGEGRQRFASHPQFAVIGQLHERVHQLAACLVGSPLPPPAPQACDLRQFCQESQKLLDSLRSLAWSAA